MREAASGGLPRTRCMHFALNRFSVERHPAPPRRPSHSEQVLQGHSRDRAEVYREPALDLAPARWRSCRLHSAASSVQARSSCPLLTLTRALCHLPGGYDGSDVEFSWLRGNDSVRGLENLRLAQYTVQRYFTLVTRTQQETGTWQDRLSQRKTAGPEVSFCRHLRLPLGPRGPSAVRWGGRAWDWHLYLLHTQHQRGSQGAQRLVRERRGQGHQRL